jgi:hypothetical protein
MSKHQSQRIRKIWQPLNRKSQIITTVAVLGLVAFQIYLWYAHSTKPQSAQVNFIQQPNKLTK